jgi:C-methyltransferase
MAKTVAPFTETRSPLRILDVACGSGIYGATAAGEREDAHVTFLDWPNVLPKTKAWAERFGVADRASYLAGDMFSVPLAGPYDLATASHIFHHFSREQCVALMRRIAGTLAPEGRIAIHDFIGTDSPAQDPAAALFSVIMLVRTQRGQTYAYGDYQEWLRDAGFDKIELHGIPGLPTRLIVAQVR